MHEMAGAGRLPHVASLLKGGLTGAVQNPRGFESGTVWQSFHTGKEPGGHPMYDGLRYFNPQTYGFSFLEQSEVGADLIWEHLSKHGKRCAVIDAPYCQIGQTINGILVADYAVHDAALGDNVITFATDPAPLAQELLDLVGPDPTGGIQSDIPLVETLQDHIDFRDKYFARVEKKGRLINHILQKEPWDYVEAVFTEPHSVGHRLWHVANPDHDQYQRHLHEALGDPIRDLYELTDKAIGEVLAQLDDRTLVIFYISHGMENHYTGVGLLDEALVQLERGVPATGDRSLKEKLRGAWRSIPSETRGRLRPFKKFFHGALSPREQDFAGNRRDRRFFEVYANYRTGGVRINLQGREANGLVAPEDYDALLTELTTDLLALKNADTGDNLVEEVLRPRDLYDGAYVDYLPDLLVSFDRRAPINRISSDKIGLIERAFPPARSGDHSRYGLFAATGAGIPPRKLNATVNAVDFFPTVCQALGVAAPGFPGKPIEHLPAAARMLEDAR